MMGAVSLSDGALSAQFEAGRLKGLSWNNRYVTPERLPLLRRRASRAAVLRRHGGVRPRSRAASGPAEPVPPGGRPLDADARVLFCRGLPPPPGERARALPRPARARSGYAAGDRRRARAAGGVTVHVLCRGEASYTVADHGRARARSVSPGASSGSRARGRTGGGVPAAQGAGPRKRLAASPPGRVGEPAVRLVFREPGAPSQSLAGREELFSLYLGRGL